MNDFQQFENGKFPQAIGSVIVAIHWLYACKELAHHQVMRRLDDTEGSWPTKLIRGKQ